jgi:hypothetical protein
MKHKWKCFVFSFANFGLWLGNGSGAFASFSGGREHAVKETRAR